MSIWFKERIFLAEFGVSDLASDVGGAGEEGAGGEAEAEDSGEGPFWDRTGAAGEECGDGGGEAGEEDGGGGLVGGLFVGVYVGANGVEFWAGLFGCEVAGEF